MTLNVTNIERISISQTAAQGDAGSVEPIFSPDGSEVLFNSSASNLIPGGTSGEQHLFLKDLTTGAVTLVSANIAGDQGDQLSDIGVFSPDGSKVLFASIADNLVPGDGNHDWDVFLKDLNTGAINLVSTDSGGNQGDETSMQPAFSGDGTKFIFYSESFNFPHGGDNPQIYVKDLSTGALTLVSSDDSGMEENSISLNPVLSPDGTKAAFTSFATNLIPDDTNGGPDIFIKNLLTGEITLASADSSGVQMHAFAGNAAFSPDGTKIAFESMPNGGSAESSIFIKNLVTGDLENVSTSVTGIQGNHASVRPVWSPDSTHLLFASDANNLTVGDHNHARDLFVKDLETGVVSRIDVTPSGVEADADSLFASFSPDGHHIVFSSEADNLVSNDTNGALDVFMVTLQDDHVISGTSGDDTLHGSNSDDIIQGHSGLDYINALDGNDTVTAGPGDDEVTGGRGDDALTGNSGNDTLFGGSGRDIIHGGSGDDVLHGDGGSDRLYGDSGNDLIYGGSGTNTMTGGGGADGFVITADNFDSHTDKITDFTVSQGDFLSLDHILEGFDPLTSAITDFIRGTEISGNTVISIDRDGTGTNFAFQEVMTLLGHTGFDIQNLYNNGNIVVQQDHA